MSPQWRARASSRSPRSGTLAFRGAFPVVSVGQVNDLVAGQAKSIRPGIRPAMDVLTRLEAGRVPCSAKIASSRGMGER
jgi:hypothetical protein